MIDLWMSRNSAINSAGNNEIKKLSHSIYGCQYHKYLPQSTSEKRYMDKSKKILEKS